MWKESWCGFLIFFLNSLVCLLSGDVVAQLVIMMVLVVATAIGCASLVWYTARHTRVMRQDDHSDETTSTASYDASISSEPSEINFEIESVCGLSDSHRTSSIHRVWRVQGGFRTTIPSYAFPLQKRVQSDCGLTGHRNGWISMNMSLFRRSWVNLTGEKNRSIFPKYNVWFNSGKLSKRKCLICGKFSWCWPKYFSTFDFIMPVVLKYLVSRPSNVFKRNVSGSQMSRNVNSVT